MSLLQRVSDSRSDVVASVPDLGVTGVGAGLVALGVQAARSRFPELPWGVDVDAAIIGAVAGVLGGLWRGWRRRASRRA